MEVLMKRLTVLLILALTGAAIAARIPGDLDGDGDVDFADFLTFAANFGQEGGDQFDPDLPGTYHDTVTVTVTDTALVYPNGETVAPRRGPGRLVLASWNVREFSDDSRDDEEMEQIADVIRNFDMVVLQGLQDGRVPNRLKVILDPGWSMAIAAIGEGGQSLYAIYWRTEGSESGGSGAVTISEVDQLSRVPFFNQFKVGQFDFVIVTVHSDYGDTKAEPRAEAALMDEVYQWTRDLYASYGDEADIILVGGFNLEPADEGFDGLRTLATPLSTGDVRTTVTETGLYDNIWLTEATQPEYTGEWGVYRFDQISFENNDAAAALAVSDHRPVWAVFSTTADDDE